MTSSSSIPIYYVNGEFVPADKAVLPVTDLSIIRGYACFDYLRTHGGELKTLDLNVRRLRKSCGLIELHFPWTDEQLKSIIKDTLRRNQKDEKEDWGIRMIATGGKVDMNNMIFPENKEKSSLILIMNKITSTAAEKFSMGVKIISVDYPRAFTTAKTTNYITAILAKKMAEQENAFEAVYVRHGLVSECSTSNIFAFFNNQLYTPDVDILEGITRALILELAKQKFQIIIGPITYGRLLEADEVFISSATKEILPVVQIDNHKIGKGKPGPNTTILKQMLDQKFGKTSKL